MDVSSTESGIIALRTEPLALLDVIEEALLLSQPLAAENSVEITGPDTRSNPTVMADRIRLKQVCLNLMSNAVKYNTPQGTITITVDVTSTQVQLNVIDAAIGIAAADKENVFQAFGRLGDANAVKGSGFGLYLSHQFVKSMRGEFDFESEHGVGSTFYFTLPLLA
jgi:signal transduction histidine kinase